MKKIVFIVLVFLLIFNACSKAKTENKQLKEKINFNALYFGIDIKEAKNIFEDKGVVIIDEYSFINEDSIRSVIVTRGTFQSEVCEIEYHFVEGFLNYGIYNFEATNVKNINEIKENLMNKLTNEFKKTPTIKFLVEQYYNWDLENGLTVEFFDYGSKIIIVYMVLDGNN